jgi:hypothetical protein
MRYSTNKSLFEKKNNIYTNKKHFKELNILLP